MRKIFADTQYWIAVTIQNDQWHDKAVQTTRSLKDYTIVTTEEVLSEFLTAFSKNGPFVRKKASLTVHAIMNNQKIDIVTQTHDSFLAGLQLYESRLDKQYSLQDCISMSTMWRESISEVLTHDQHFAQEGFSLLL